MNDRTSDPNGREKHVIAKSGVYPADESLFVLDIQSVVVYSTAFGRTTTINPSAHLVSPDTLVTKYNNLNKY